MERKRASDKINKKVSLTGMPLIQREEREVETESERDYT